MNKQDSILRTGFALFSAITSFIFVYYAVSILSGETASEWLKTFAYVAGGYGLLNVYLLSWAWRSQVSWTVSVNVVISVCLLGVVIMDLIRDGLKDMPQLGGILGLVLVLGINWFAIKKLCQQKQP